MKLLISYIKYFIIGESSLFSMILDVTGGTIIAAMDLMIS